MLIIKYERLYPANLLSHIDTLRLFNRIFRRAGVPVKYSEGFVPHMLLYFTPPQPLGLESVCEYVVADTDVTAVDGAANANAALINRLQSACPTGINIVGCTPAERNPNYAALVSRAEYLVELEGIGSAAEKVAAQESLVMQYNGKEKDVRPLIHKITSQDVNAARFVLACGSAANLKCDTLLKELCRIYNLNYSAAKILKTAMFIGETQI